MDQTTRFVLSAVDSTGPAFTKVRAGLQQLGGKAQEAGGLLSSLGIGLAGGLFAGAGVASTVAAFKGLANGLDQLNDAADATGSTVERLSALEDLGARTGVAFDTITGGVIKFNKALQDAGKPDSEEAQVFKRLGLDLAELKRLDPSDAFIKTAQAFGTFAAGGERARGEYLLLGRSTKELAPLLKDVAEAGQLNATVTAAQAEEAEKFNKHLAGLAKNSQDFGRSLLIDVLPAMNTFLERLQLLRAGPGLVAAAGQALRGNVFGNAADGLAFYEKKLQSIDAEIQSISSSKGPEFLKRDSIAGLNGKREDIAKFAAYYKALSAQGLSGLAAGAGLGSIDQFAGAGGKKFGTITGGKTKDAKEEKPLKFFDYADEVQKSVTQLIEGTDTAKLAKITDQLVALDKLAAAGLDAGIVDQARKALTGSARDFIFPEVPAEIAERLRAVNAAIAATPSAELERHRTLMADLTKEYEKGRFGIVGSAEAMAAYGEVANTALGNLPQQMQQVASMTEELGQTMRYQVGDNLFSAMEGRFSDIGKSWASLLRRMVANALSVDLGNALLGRKDAGGSSDLFGGLFKLFGAFAGAGTGAPMEASTGMGPFAAAGGARALAAGGAGQGGGFQQVNNFAVGVGRSELRNALDQTKRSTLATWQEMQRRGRFA
jgi:hypothetical protein